MSGQRTGPRLARLQWQVRRLCCLFLPGAGMLYCHTIVSEPRRLYSYLVCNRQSYVYRFAVLSLSSGQDCPSPRLTQSCHIASSTRLPTRESAELYGALYRNHGHVVEQVRETSGRVSYPPELLCLAVNVVCPHTLAKPGQ